MKRFLSMFAVLCGCLSVACVFSDESAEEKKTTAERYFPLTQGSLWNYQWIRTDHAAGRADTSYYSISAQELATIDGKLYTLFLKSSGSETHYRIEGDIVYEYPPDMPVEIPEIDFSLAAGATRSETMAFSESPGDTMRMAGTITYVGQEIVETPIGSFTDCKVYELSAADENGVMFGYIKVWLAPDVGRVKIIEKDYENGVLTKTSISTIVRYAIPGGKSGGGSGKYTITGRVVDPNGNGIADVFLRLYTGGEILPTALTDPNGVYVFSAQPAGAYKVSVETDPLEYWLGSVSAEIYVVASDLTVPDFIAMPKHSPNGHTLSGTITTAAGIPFVGTHAILTRLFAIWDVDTDMSGIYRFEGLLDGGYTLVFNHEKFSFDPDSLTVTVTGADVTVNTIATGGSSITGQLVTPAGNAVVGITVTLELPGVDSLQTTTGADGRYAFAQLYNETYFLRYQRAGYLVQPGIQIVTVSGSDVVLSDGIVLPSEGSRTIRGSITNASGTGLPSCQVTIYDPEYMTGYNSWSDENGNFVFGRLFDGTFIVTPVTPTPGNHRITPSSRTVTVAGSDVSGVTFTYE